MLLYFNIWISIKEYKICFLLCSVLPKKVAKYTIDVRQKGARGREKPKKYKKKLITNSLFIKYVDYFVFSPLFVADPVLSVYIFFAVERENLEVRLLELEKTVFLKLR